MHKLIECPKNMAYLEKYKLENNFQIDTWLSIQVTRARL